MCQFSDSEDDAVRTQPIGDALGNDFVVDTAMNDTAVSHDTSKAKRGKINFITPRLVSALDNAKVSDGMAIHIITAAADALGHNVEDLIINRSTIHRIRQKNRREESKTIQDDFIKTVR